MRRDDPRLRARLTAALASAIAIAFVVTVAAVASSPAPRQDDGAAPPSATAPSHPTTTSSTSAPQRDRTVDRSPDPRDLAEEDLPAQDEPSEDAARPAEPTPAPTPSAEPSPTPRTEEPPASPDVERSPTPRDHGAPLWDRWFRAEHLRQGDETVVVAGDRPLHVGFLRQEGGDGLVWMTSCNTFGGDLAVGRDRLTVRDIGGTAAGCEEVQQDQEEWLADFFAEGPHWRSLGERLRLWTPDGRRIDLVEDPEGPGPPWS